MHQFFLLTLAALASASPAPQGKMGGMGAKSGGTGKYGPVSYAVSPQFPGYTVYVPPKAAGEKLPVILWANGMCSDDGSGFSSFLLEVSSHGYIIIANGEPGSGMSKQAGQDKIKKALEIVDKQAGTGVLANADKTRIAAAGQSCGGMNTYLLANDPRIKCIGIFDGARGAAKFSPPVGFFVGGTSDMAWSNTQSAWKGLDASSNAILVNNPKGGHMQDFFTSNGGLIAYAGRSWFDWILKNSTEGKQNLVGGAKLKAAGWSVELKGLKQ